jgi:hypothetical protein
LISSRVTSQGPIGPKVSQPLPFPLAGALELEGALRDVVTDAIAGDVFDGVFLLDIARALADHDRDFDFPVELGRVLRDHHVVVRPDDAVRRLRKQNRLGRDRLAGLGGGSA